MKGVLDHAALKTRQRAIRAGFPETMGLRVHRAISWIGRAETCGEDDDARFIFLWIAFNAAYADEREFQAIAPGERAAFADFFGRLVALDGGASTRPSGSGFRGRSGCCWKTAMFSIRSGSITTASTDSTIGKIDSSPQPGPSRRLSRPATRRAFSVSSSTGSMFCATSWSMAVPPGTAA